MIRFWPASDASFKLDRDGFVRAYQEAFSRAPYLKKYSREEILQRVWYPNVRDGIVILALEDERVVGFGCALPLLKAPADVQAFLRSAARTSRLSIDLGRTWYMSELGVLGTHRGRGLGSALIKHRLLTIHHRGGNHYIARTAAKEPNSIGLYRRIGAVGLNGLQDVSASKQAQVYFYGECNSAIKKLIAPAA